MLQLEGSAAYLLEVDAVLIKQALETPDEDDAEAKKKKMIEWRKRM